MTLFKKIIIGSLCLTLLFGCSGIQARIAEVVTSSEVSSAGLPLDPKSTFAQDTESIHLTIKMVDVKSEVEVITRWVFTDNFNEDGTRSDYVIDEGSAVTSEDGVVHFALSKPDRGWPSGNYRVDLLLNGGDTVDRSVSFVVL